MSDHRLAISNYTLFIPALVVKPLLLIEHDLLKQARMRSDKTSSKQLIISFLYLLEDHTQRDYLGMLLHTGNLDRQGLEGTLE